MAETIQGHEAVGGATKRGAPDTSVVLPPAVRAAAERSEALVRQAKEAREAAPPSDNPATTQCHGGAAPSALRPMAWRW